MRIHVSLLALFAVVAPAAAHAMTIDAKALARYDLSYVTCERTFPDMKGHRDEAYLSLWRVKADAKARAELAAVRKGAVYQAERTRAQKAAAKGTASAASSPIEKQCQALWHESQGMTKS